VPAQPGDEHGLPAAAGEGFTVAIEAVLHSTPELRGLAGKSATVLGRHAGERREHAPHILFTQCISLGERLLLRELGQVEATEEAMRAVEHALREAAERPLRARIEAAALIVVGEVVASRKLEPDLPPRSEHDPDWWIARVAVQSVLKGAKPKGEVEVLFANSTDIVWYRSPKLHRGTSGIFLLHHVKPDEAPRELPRGVYRATDPLDFLPAGRLAEVQRLLGRGGEEER